MRDKIIVPFEITYDYVNTLDTDAYTIASVPAKAETQCLVPVRLELWKAAGTAYTLYDKYKGDGVTTDGDSLYPFIDQSQFGIQSNQFEPFWIGRYLIVYDVNTYEYSGRSDARNVIFKIPMDNFLNVAAGRGVVAFPVGGLCLTPDDTVLKMRALSPIAGGTGSIVGRVFFDEYPTKR